VKFNDADLLGIPIRVTLGPRTLEKGNVEVKKRTEKEAALVPLDGVVARLKEMIGG
jgi:prolyl-tRNA synthetase